ncbi:MAG: hypothetical protein QME64_00545 [bacterium]|nr:hypothetical protein [bacterium]
MAIPNSEVEVDDAIINAVVEYIRKRHPKFEIKTKVPLKKLFPQPKSPRLLRFWQAQSHADIAIFRDGKLVAILEPGGGAHLTDEKQVYRDTLKRMICWLNMIKCEHILNSLVVGYMQTREWKLFIKKLLYRKEKLR